MVEWEDFDNLSVAEIAEAARLEAMRLLPDSWLGTVEVHNSCETKSFKGRAEAKAWCIAEARNMLTEALEKLND